MKQSHTFRAVIESSDKGGAYIRIPFDVEAAFGKKRVPVKALINGEPYRGTLVRMGEPCHILGVLKEIRQRIGKTFGDEVEVTLDEDVELRRVKMPADLQAALNEYPDVKVLFEKLSYTHQKEYVEWIVDAKKDETRKGRIAKTIVQLRQGKKGI